VEFFTGRIQLFSLIAHFLWINFWWGVMNLLPVHPLDGGQISELFVRPQKRVHQIAIAAASAVVVFALWRGDLYLSLLFGYLCWRNIQAVKGLSWQ
jgi:Zn-dependent protease